MRIQKTDSIKAFSWDKIPLSLLLLVIVLCTVAVYYNSLSSEFVWDDRALILKDKTVHNLKNIDRSFRRDFFDISEEEKIKYGYFRPLITVSYMVDYALWGENPFGFHLTNLLVHVLCSLLVFAIFLALGFSRGQALLGGVIFGIHPIHTESVSWIAGRTDLFSGLFLFSALGAYLVYRKGDVPDLKSAVPVRFWYFLSLFCFALSLLSKEMGILLVLMLPVLEWLHFGRRESTRSWPEILKINAPYWVLAGGFFFWHSRVTIRLTSPFLETDAKNLPIYLATFFKSFWLYVYKLVFPLRLSAYLRLPLVNNLSHPDVVLFLGMLVIFIYLLLMGFQKKPLLGVGGGLFLAAMVPLSNVIKITGPKSMGFTMAERFLYIPSFAFFFLVISALSWGKEILEKKNPSVVRWLFPVLLGALIAGLGYRTVLRNRDWQSDNTLFLAESEENKDSPLIQSNLARYYSRHGQYDKALTYYQKALAAAPESTRILNNLGRALVEMKKFKQALPYLEKAIELDPDSFQFHNNLGLAKAGLKHYWEAVELYQKALKLYPNSDKVFNNLGVAYKNLNKFTQALACYKNAVALNKNYASPYKNMGIIYLQGFNEPGLAREAIKKSLELDPGQPETASLKRILSAIDSKAAN